jgi:hypothetical protein
MIISRNLKLGMDLTSENNSHVASQFRQAARLDWPVLRKGKITRETKTRRRNDFVKTAAGIECAGMQIIGFVCELLPKCPNPDPTLNWQA